MIGKKIRTLRIARGLSQEQLSEATGISRISIANHELGRRKPPVDVLEKYCEFFEVGLSYFQELTEHDAVLDLLARSRVIFTSKISDKEKQEVYEEIMRLYLNSRGK